MTLHPVREALLGELAILGRELGWSLDELLDLSHRDRSLILAIVTDLDQRGRRGGRNAN